ncbi:MAG: hypothetical protein RL096_940, partial [Actinomycetota bacterium]
MAKTSNKANKTPGRMAQLVSVYRMTIKADSTALWWSLLALAIGVL